MKRVFATCIISLFLLSCENVDVLVMTDAASDVVTAVTLSDEEVRNLAEKAITVFDNKHHVATTQNPYAVRLRRLTNGHLSRDGRTFNYQVYVTDEVNAFAMADGSIRVFSGLMDIMEDRELLFIIGHEMGHVVKDHSRKQVVMAYAARAVRKGLASYDSEVGQIAGSILGGLAQQLVNAQFSQHEERQADLYGLAFIGDLGYDETPAVSALNKLAELARNHTLLSSHPHPESRAQRLLQGGESEEQQSLVKTVFDHGVRFVTWLLALVNALLRWLLSFF